MKRLSVWLCGVLLSLTAGAAAGQEEAVPAIYVAGRAEAVLEPDYAEWTVQIVTQDASPKLALEVNDAVMQSLLKIAKSAKVDEKEITRGRPLIEQQLRNGDRARPDIDDYLSTRVERRVTFNMRDLDEFEEALVAVQQLGLIYQVRYKSSAYDKTLDKIRREALLDARSRAEEQADALGQKIGPAISVQVTLNEDAYRGGGGLFGADDDDWRDAEDREAAGPDGKVRVVAYAYVDFKLEP